MMVTTTNNSTKCQNRRCDITQTDDDEISKLSNVVGFEAVVESCFCNGDLLRTNYQHSTNNYQLFTIRRGTWDEDGFR